MPVTLSIDIHSDGATYHFERTNTDPQDDALPVVTERQLAFRWKIGLNTLRRGRIRSLDSAMRASWEIREDGPRQPHLTALASHASELSLYMAPERGLLMSWGSALLRVENQTALDWHMVEAIRQ